jgi:hypothetical protein
VSPDARSAARWRHDLEADLSGRDDTEVWNPETLGPALVAASAIDPVMTVEQVGELFEHLNSKQREELLGAAWLVNGEATSVPFSLLASVTLGSRTDEK